MKKALGYSTDIIVVFLLLFALVSCGIFFYNINLCVDTSYYAGVTRLILEGKVPFRDFKLEYTPFSFYLFCIPASIWGVSYKVALGVSCLLQLITGFLFGKLTYHFIKSKVIAIASSALFLLFSLCYEGAHYLLEPFVLFWGFLALLLVVKKHSNINYLAGIFCFCSFWSKQYGIGFFFLSALFIIIDNSYSNSRIREIIKLTIGLLLAFAISVAFFLIQGVSLQEMFSLSGNEYEKYGFQGLIDAYSIVFRVFPFIILPILFYFYNWKKIKSNALLIISIAGIVGFMLQCYVRFYAHYLQLVFPFCILLIISLASSIKKDRIILLLLLASSIIPCYFVSSADREFLNSDSRRIPYSSSDSIADYIPRGSEKVYVSINMLFVTINNSYDPPMLKEYGMSNGFMNKPDEILNLIEDASYCVIGKKDFESQKKYTAEIRDYLSTSFYSDTLDFEGDQCDCIVYKKR